MSYTFSRAYNFKFYLNANHYIVIDGKAGEIHPHTWEFAIEIKLNHDEFVQFNHIEKAIDQFFDQYQNQVMNDFEPFNHTNPTLENISEHFIVEISRIVKELGGTLIQMESSETPTRSYILRFEEDSNFSHDGEMNRISDLSVIADQIAEEVLGANSGE